MNARTDTLDLASMTAEALAALAVAIRQELSKRPCKATRKSRKDNRTEAQLIQDAIDSITV